MSLPSSSRNQLDEAFAALRSDLVQEDGPRISTMRNYRFAIVPYPPTEEFGLRQRVQRLTHDLVAHGWSVLSISLQALLVKRLRALGDDTLDRLVEMERRLAANERARGLNYLAGRISPLIEGPDGLAADCAKIIGDHIDAHPDRVERTLALIGRAGALYPFFRSSALLRHLDGQTRNVPVVLLYPGERRGDSGLSFMGQLEPDRDYRPRIYP
ncbi:MAG: DUF1788 domain-containing protein [Myxococcota bacterium]